MANTFFQSTGLATALMGTGSLLSTLNNGFIDLYAGAVPADADAAVGGATLICRLTLAGDGVTGLPLEQSGRFLRKPAAAEWSATNLDSGTLTFYRHVTAADTGAASTSEARLQGTIGQTNAAEMTLIDVALVLGQTFALQSYVLEQPVHG